MIDIVKKKVIYHILQNSLVCIFIHPISSTILSFVNFDNFCFRLEKLQVRRPIEKLKRNIVSTYPLIHERVLLLMTHFLIYKRLYCIVLFWFYFIHERNHQHWCYYNNRSHFKELHVRKLFYGIYHIKLEF